MATPAPAADPFAMPSASPFESPKVDKYTVKSHDGLYNLVVTKENALPTQGQSSAKVAKVSLELVKGATLVAKIADAKEAICSGRNGEYFSEFVPYADNIEAYCKSVAKSLVKVVKHDDHYQVLIFHGAAKEDEPVPRTVVRFAARDNKVDQHNVLPTLLHLLSQANGN